jgi:hypothetical protein
MLLAIKLTTADPTIATLTGAHAQSIAGCAIPDEPA